MNNGRCEYTFFWFIENYSYCWHKNGEILFSPKFTIHKLGSTVWTLQLYPRGMDEDDEGYISLSLNRDVDDDGPESISLNYEFSVLSADGSARFCQEQHYAFTKNTGLGYGNFLKIDEIRFLPQDILTVRCRIWQGNGNIRNIGQSSARTLIRIVKHCFLHVLENFSSLQANVKQTIKIPSHSKKGHFISSSLYFNEGLCGKEKIMIEIVPSDTKRILHKCELSLLDGSGYAIKCGKADSRYDAVKKIIHTMPLSLTRDEISKRKSEYLPDDKLTLICECTFSSGFEFQTMEEYSEPNAIPLAVIKQKVSRVHRKCDDKIVEKLSSYPSVSEDMKAIYINQDLTDVELKTKTKSFPAHKIVLCARSPVFKAMMTNDMTEKNTDCIHIDDLEEDIVQHLLLFLYSDCIKDLQWNTATHLYYAADKYQIGKLKIVCSSFLLENIDTTNAAELLLLADTHNDSDLKKSVEDFILEHEEKIFGSKEWDTVAETNPLLALKTMQLKYKRKTELNSL